MNISFESSSYRLELHDFKFLFDLWEDKLNSIIAWLEWFIEDVLNTKLIKFGYHFTASMNGQVVHEQAQLSIAWFCIKLSYILDEFWYIDRFLKYFPMVNACRRVNRHK